jgi:pantoate--beta-alanine ligase
MTAPAADFELTTASPHTTAAVATVLTTTVLALREQLERARRAGQRVGLVPTMGALHEGHLSLVKRARAECDLVVVSIFVNPSQFGPHEDFSKYPRALENDLSLLRGLAEIVFAPAGDEVYRPDHATWVEVGEIADVLEGTYRPGHFRGVVTIVLKLFNMVQPAMAYFGQKDFQQALVIRRMAADLNVPVMIQVCPIVREADGLAMSSRNRYLSADGRRRALVLSRSLETAKGLAAKGERKASAIATAIRGTIETAEDARIDYIALVDPQTLQPIETLSAPTLVALAVTIDNTRLIDNCLL